MPSHLGPPPTINTLERHQRLRLIRSNRKLEAVLGSVPYYPEPEFAEMVIHDSDLKANRRGGRIFAHSPSPTPSASSSTTSLGSTEDRGLLNKSFNYTSPYVKQSTRSKNSAPVSQLSRPLLLRLRSVPFRPSDRRTALLSPRLPSVAPGSPTSPKFAIDLENLQSTGLDQRRKKMARIVRTLGENVPLDLVFPPKSADSPEKPTKMRSTERKPIPVSFASSAPASYPSQPHVVSKPKPLPSHNHGPSGLSQHPRITPPAASQPSSNNNPKEEPRVPTIAERRRKTRPRSLSLSTGTDILVAAAKIYANNGLSSTAAHPDPERSKKQDYTLTIDEKATKDIIQTRSPLAFQTIIPSTSSVPQHRYAHSSPSNINFEVNVREETTSTHSSKLHAKPSSVGGAHSPSSFTQRGKRRERGWSGEWNQDLQEVVRTLRTMKAR